MKLFDLLCGWLPGFTIVFSSTVVFLIFPDAVRPILNWYYQYVPIISDLTRINVSRFASKYTLDIVLFWELTRAIVQVEVPLLAILIAPLTYIFTNSISREFKIDSFYVLIASIGALCSLYILYFDVGLLFGDGINRLSDLGRVGIFTYAFFGFFVFAFFQWCIVLWAMRHKSDRFL